ncbi:hypothetical protein CTI12_AA209680 [Artemisia annua]|uniref:Proton-dependent oligopeptide transporter family n=1 Tax=Artemisia annua TaxID=35608 RepID=A0A2U1P041_ARTAN|nr:hypothetical protein CTI12_AA209680 [Artemisia annua]
MDAGLIILYSWLGFLAISTLVLVFFWKDYYFIYNHQLLYVIGLAFSRSLTSYAIITVLVWYFTEYGNDLVTSAIYFNIQGSLSSLLVIYMAHAADSFVGRFQALLFSNTAYIGGLMLVWMFNPYDVKWLILVIIVLLSFGTSGSNVLQDVLKDLVNDIDKSQDRTKTRSLARAAIWSRIAYVSGAISSIMWVAPDAIIGVHSSWSSSFLICMITMTITLTIFCKGHNIYHQGELTERPVEAFFRVFLASIKKLPKCNTRRLTKFTRQDRPQQNLKTKKNGNKEILQERPSLDSDTNGKEDMIVVKSLLRMFPMWGMFFVVSLISATGSTFFLQQYNNLKTNISISIQIYNVFQDLSEFCIPFLYTWICGSHKNNKVQIGVGMLCGIVSCTCALVLEVYRLKEVNQLVDKHENTSISFLWLLPQFCVLGCMEGLTREGLLEFYMAQMKEEPLRSYGEEYIEIVTGFGKLLNIFLILIFQSQLGWFGNTINNSQLDNYYLVMVCVGSANFMIYCCVARRFYKDDERLQDLVNHNQQHDNQLLANVDSQQDHRSPKGFLNPSSGTKGDNNGSGSNDSGTGLAGQASVSYDRVADQTNTVDNTDNANLPDGDGVSVSQKAGRLHHVTNQVPRHNHEEHKSGLDGMGFNQENPISLDTTYGSNINPKGDGATSFANVLKPERAPRKHEAGAPSTGAPDDGFKEVLSRKAKAKGKRTSSGFHMGKGASLAPKKQIYVAKKKNSEAGAAVQTSNTYEALNSLGGG